MSFILLYRHDATLVPEDEFTVAHEMIADDLCESEGWVVYSGPHPSERDAWELVPDMDDPIFAPALVEVA